LPVPSLSQEARNWVARVAQVIAELVDDGWDEDALGVHVLGSTMHAYLDPLAATGITVRCDTSTPARQGDSALSWGYTDRYGLPLHALVRYQVGVLNHISSQSPRR
jgi:hypothetical protein